MLSLERICIVLVVVLVGTQAVAQPTPASIDTPLAAYAALAPGEVEGDLLARARMALSMGSAGPAAALLDLADLEPSAAADVSSALEVLAVAPGERAVVEIARAQWRPFPSQDIPAPRALATLDEALDALAIETGVPFDARAWTRSIDAPVQAALRDVVLAHLLLVDADKRPDATASLRANARDASLAMTMDALAGLQTSRATAPIEVCDAFAFDLSGVDSTYECDVPLLVDVGGSDRYRNNAGANREMAGLLVDLEGDDLYADHDPASSSFAGGTSGGIGMLLDLAGDDVYRSRFLTDGAAGGGAISFGAALLYDAEGDDVYDGWAGTDVESGGTSFGALHGAAVLDGIGLLVDLRGDDTYTARADGWGVSAANGGAVRYGSALLYDAEGHDTYATSGELAYHFAAQGGSSNGHALHIDRSGDDTYDFRPPPLALAGGNGAAAMGFGALLDLDGSDVFRGEARGPGAVNGGAGRGRLEGAGAKPGSAALLYVGGRDTAYFTNGTGAGAARGYAAALLIDEGGVNLYESGPYCGRFSIEEAGMPATRNETSAVYDGRYAFVFGGNATFGFPTATDAIVEFDPLSNLTRTRGASLPEPLVGTSAVWTGTRALIFGGWSDGYVDTILEYDPQNDTITTLSATLPTPRARTGAAWIGERAYVVGGVDASGHLAEIVEFDLRNGTVVTLPQSIPPIVVGGAPGLASPSVVGADDRVLIIGGSSPDAGSSVRVWSYDPATDVLSETFSMAGFGAYGTPAALHRGVIYLFGGSAGDKSSSSHSQIVAYDPVNGTTSVISELNLVPVGAPFGSAVSDGTYIYHFGDRSSAGDATSVLAFDPDNHLCARAFAQGAGAQIGVGILIDRGERATFRLGAGVTGQGAGEQGVGLLRREPSGGPRFSTYDASLGSTPLVVAGAGLGLRLDEGIYELLGAPPDLTCGSAAELAAASIRLFGDEATSARVCGLDDATRRPILDPQTGKPMQSVEKPPIHCEDLSLDCEGLVEDDPLLEYLYHAATEFAGHDNVTMTTQGGLAVLTGTLAGASHQTMHFTLKQLSADDAQPCSWACLETE